MIAYLFVIAKSVKRSEECRVSSNVSYYPGRIPLSSLAEMPAKNEARASRPGVRVLSHAFKSTPILSGVDHKCRY